MFVNKANVYLINTTVANNETGIREDGPCAVVGVKNSILWGNGSGSFGDQITADYVINHSCIQSSDGVPGTGNIDEDPEFANPAGDFRLTTISPCVDSGDTSVFESYDDLDDLNQNGETIDEPIPDLDLRERVQRFEVATCVIDMGAYEFLAAGCIGDVTGPGDQPNCVVDVDDLLAVINAWGACMNPCPANIVPACSSDTDVDVDDLIAIINNWGDCDGICAFNQGDVLYATMPESIEDCMEQADNRCPGDEECWLEVFEGCVEALCQAEIIECDE